MPRDERKRQDQLARKAAKRKQHLQSSQRSTAATTGLLTERDAGSTGSGLAGA